MLRLIVFLALNFGALAIGSVLMGSIPNNTWYDQLNKAPWTPPGWVFGAAWFTVMLTFSIFMYQVSGTVPAVQLRHLYTVFALQWVLNVLWNPVFFRWHSPIPALVIIVALAAVVMYLLIWGKQHAGWSALWILPYAAWLCIAISLNAYVVVKN